MRTWPGSISNSSWRCFGIGTFSDQSSWDRNRLSTGQAANIAKPRLEPRSLANPSWFNTRPARPMESIEKVQSHSTLGSIAAGTLESGHAGLDSCNMQARNYLNTIKYAQASAKIKSDPRKARATSGENSRRRAGLFPHQGFRSNHHAGHCREGRSRYRRRRTTTIHRKTPS